MRELAFHEMNQVAGAELEKMPVYEPPQVIEANELAQAIVCVALPITYLAEYAIDLGLFSSQEVTGK